MDEQNFEQDGLNEEAINKLVDFLSQIIPLDLNHVYREQIANGNNGVPQPYYSPYIPDYPIGTPYPLYYHPNASSRPGSFIDQTSGFRFANSHTQPQLGVNAGPYGPHPVMTQQPRMDQNLHQPYPLPPGVLNLPMSPPYVTPQGELYGPPSMNQFAPGQPLPITRGHPSIEDTAGASSAGSVSPAVSPFPTPAILQINVQQLKELREPKIGEPSAHSPTATSSDAASQPAPPAPPASLAPPTPDGGLRNSQPRKRRRDSLPSLAAENAPESIDPPFDLAFELYFDTVVKDYEDWKADMIEEERRKARILELRAQ